MKFRDWIVLICKAFLWILPCLLILAIVIMLAMKPGNEEFADTTGNTSTVDTQTAEASDDNATAEHTDVTDNAEITDTTEGNVEGYNVDSFFAENVQLGAVEGVDDGALDDTVPVGSVPDQTDKVTKPDNEGVKVMDDRLDPLHPDFDITLLTYEAYTAMDADRQRAVVEAFSSPEVFIAWYNAVKARYEAEHPNIELGKDGIIDGKDFG